MLEGRAVFQRGEDRLEKCAKKNCEQFREEKSRVLPCKRKLPPPPPPPLQPGMGKDKLARSSAETALVGS